MHTKIISSAVPVAVALLLVAGCGRSPEHGTAEGSSGVKTGAGSAIHVRYEAMVSGGDAAGTTQIQDVIVDGSRFRMSVADKADPHRVLYNIVWDGQALLVDEPGAGPPSREVDPPADQRPGALVMHPGDAAFGQACPGGRRGAAARVAGRPGTVYDCPAHRVGDTDTEAGQITLDDATGLLLATHGTGGDQRAVTVEVGVSTTAQTFSTELPPGSATDPTRPGVLGSVPSVPLVGGGTLQLAEVRNGPSLVVVADLKGLKALLGTVLPATANGTNPRVYGLLWAMPGPGWKGSLLNQSDTDQFVAEVSNQAGRMPVPVGIDIKGSAAGEDLRTFDQVQSGTAVLAAINPDGSLAWTATDAQLNADRTQLDDWIAAQK